MQSCTAEAQALLPERVVISLAGADEMGNVLHNDGGAPMDLSGPIILCGRSTNDTVRGYNGRITHLALFDQALTPLETYAIFKQVINSLTSSEQPSQLYMYDSSLRF